MMYNAKYDQLTQSSFKCRICNVCFPDPTELRAHSMLKHKGHMLRPIKV